MSKMILRPHNAKGKASITFDGDSSNDSAVTPRFFFGLCPVSLKNEDLKACSGCLCVCYADKEQQKRDWRKHKVLCKALRPLVQKENGSLLHPLSGRPQASMEIQQILVTSLGRQLNQFEIDLLMYPRLCSLCLKGDQSSMVNCPECRCVAYCGLAHLEEDQVKHEKSCKLLKICQEDYVVQVEAAQKSTQVKLKNFAPVFRSHAALPKDIDVALRPDLEANLEKPREVTPKLFECHLRHLSFRYTGPLTVLLGLFSSSSSPLSSSSLTIHLVGARAAEVADLDSWEIILAHLPKLKRLTVVMVGPELTWPYPCDDFCYESSSLRDAMPEAEVRYIFVRQEYHKAVKVLPRPDCVAALNCGFIFYKSWDATIPSLLRHPHVPLVFTEYYEEDCTLNLDKVSALVGPRHDLVVKTAPTENRFASLLPARIPTGFAFCRFDRRAIVLSNDFVCIVEKKA